MAKRQSIEAKVLEFFTDGDAKVVETVYNLIQPIVKKRFGAVKKAKSKETQISKRLEKIIPLVGQAGGQAI